jgi:hypothetical protein
MAANEAPHFTKNGIVGSAISTAANTSSMGTGTIGTDIWKIVTGAAEGTWIEKVRLMALATTPTATTATLGRLFVSSVSSGVTTSADTFLLDEISLPIVAADSALVPQNCLDILVNFRLPFGYTLLFTTHAAPAANTNWRATALGGGDY